MSRHDLDPVNPAHEVVVGWDPPLCTYFAQVLNTTADEESDAYTVLWIGTKFSEVLAIGTILAAVRPYAHLPNSLAKDLLEDFRNDQLAACLPESHETTSTPRDGDHRSMDPGSWEPLSKVDAPNGQKIMLIELLDYRRFRLGMLPLVVASMGISFLLAHGIAKLITLLPNLG